MDSDGQLLERYVKGHDEEAFAELVRRHINAIYSSALRRVCGDSHLAEDVTQQFFVGLAHRARELQAHPSLTA